MRYYLIVFTTVIFTGCASLTQGTTQLLTFTIDPEEAAVRQGRMPATAYDATHGFADQYIVEVPVFDAMAIEAGLIIDQTNSRTFPLNLPAPVSIRFFKA